MKYLKHFVIIMIFTFMSLSSTMSFADSIIHTDEMYTPRGMYHDEKNQRMIFVDYNANAVFELNLSNLKVKRIAGKSLGKDAYGLPIGGFKDGKAEEALFRNPSDVIVLSTGAIIVADTGNHAIRQIFQGKVTTIAGGKEVKEGKDKQEKWGFKDGSRQTAKFHYPSGLAVANGAIYVADTENNAIRKILTNGTVKSLDVKVNKPSGIFVMNREIYITSMEDHRIYLLKNEKELTLIGGGKISDKTRQGYRDGGLTRAEFFVPSDVFRYQDKIYIADAGNHAVRRISEKKTTNGKKEMTVETVVGGKIGFSDEKSGRLLLDTPRSVITVGNRLYVADTNNARILVFDNASKLVPVHNYEKCEDLTTVHIYVDGGKLEPEDIAPVMRDGNTYLPVRLLIESVGGEAKWLPEEAAVLCKYGDKEIKITKNQYISESGRTLVRVRIIESLGLKVEWNDEYRAVIINTY